MKLRPRSPRQSILGDVGNSALNILLPNHYLTPPKREGATDPILEGSFYEIDHSKLPPKAPPMLHDVRAVMVTAKSEQNVTIRYPSIQSLEAYFGNLDHTSIRPELYPALDVKYDMEPRLAVEVLRSQIPSREFDKLRQSKYFWSTKCLWTEQLLPLLATHDSGASEAKHGPCFSKLQCSSIKGWGLKKFVAYLPSSGEPIDLGKSKDVGFGEGKELVKKEGHETKDQGIIQYCRKRKLDRPLHSNSNKSKHIPDTKDIVVKDEIKAKKDAVYIERWTLKRYESAAILLMEILKKSGAVHGNPISRAQLRFEARKKIGDTGLLDHLLKHLAGKVVPHDGNDRLRRRCDAEGKMEYWIESADLAKIRKEAGVNDPFWIPPPGWKLGDKIELSNCGCCQEVHMLKEELNIMRKKMAELQSEEENEQPINLMMPCCTATSSGREREGNLNKRETYEVLMKKKLLMDEQLKQISKALMELKEDVKMQPNKEETAVKQQVTASTSQSSQVEEMNEDLEKTLAGELSNGHGKTQREESQLRLLKPCKRLENISSTSLCQEEDHMMQDILDPPSASGSPLSTTTS